MLLGELFNMARIIGIDCGLKRTGIAETDDNQIIASPLTTVDTNELIPFLKDYVSSHVVEAIVLGEPKDLLMRETNSTEAVQKIKATLQSTFPNLKVESVDERFTSKMALDAMIMAGSSKKQRRQKGNIDKISAAIILQSYLEQKG